MCSAPALLPEPQDCPLQQWSTASDSDTPSRGGQPLTPHPTPARHCQLSFSVRPSVPSALHPSECGQGLIAVRAPARHSPLLSLSIPPSLPHSHSPSLSRSRSGENHTQPAECRPPQRVVFVRPAHAGSETARGLCSAETSFAPVGEWVRTLFRATQPT